MRPHTRTQCTDGKECLECAPPPSASHDEGPGFSPYAASGSHQSPLLNDPFVAPTSGPLRRWVKISFSEHLKFHILIWVSNWMTFWQVDHKCCSSCKACRGDSCCSCRSRCRQGRWARRRWRRHQHQPVNSHCRTTGGDLGQDLKLHVFQRNKPSQIGECIFLAIHIFESYFTSCQVCQKPVFLYC